MASSPNQESTSQSARQAWAIDADGHVLEPPRALPEYIEAKFKDRAPRIVERGGQEFWEGDAWLRYTATNVGSSVRRAGDRASRMRRDHAMEPVRVQRPEHAAVQPGQSRGILSRGPA